MNPLDLKQVKTDSNQIWTGSKCPARKMILLSKDGIYMYSSALQSLQLKFPSDGMSMFVLEGFVCESPVWTKAQQLAVKVLLGDKLAAYVLAEEVLKDDQTAAEALNSIAQPTEPQ